VQDGIVLLDPDLNATFLNRKMREFWEISEELATSRPSYASLSPATGGLRPDLAPEDAADFAAKRLAEVRAGDHVRDLQTTDNRRVRAHCTNLAGGGRMLTYCDITDLAAMRSSLSGWPPPIR